MQFEEVSNPEILSLRTDCVLQEKSNHSCNGQSAIFDFQFAMTKQIGTFEST